jgi:hypothetical protein
MKLEGSILLTNPNLFRPSRKIKGDLFLNFKTWSDFRRAAVGSSTAWAILFEYIWWAEHSGQGDDV